MRAGEQPLSGSVRWPVEEPVMSWPLGTVPVAGQGMLALPDGDRESGAL